jgi:trk system potassium uptake protein TrkH
MNKKTILGFLGNICILEAILMLFPVLVGFIYKDDALVINAFLITMAILLILGFALRKLTPKNPKYNLKEGFAITGLSWFLLSFFGGLPFVLANELNSIIDSTFEMASGFTTTGSSIIPNVEAISQSLLFWRSFSHLIGGMGVLVFAFAFIPRMGEGSVNIMKAEVPGPTFGKVTSKNQSSAGILYQIYLVMTAVLVLLLMLTGMNLFDSLIHAFGAAGTGGFSNKVLSVGYFNNPAAEYILSIAMILFGVNFNLYYLLLKKHFKQVFKNEELRLFLTIITIACILIMLNIGKDYSSLEKLFRDVLFTVSTIISTTGYATVDFGLWPLFSHLVLLLIMFTGSMAGSTAGGLKQSRILIYLKSFKREIQCAMNPRLVKPITVDDKPVSSSYIKSVLNYLGLYLSIFICGVLLVSVTQNDFLTAFSSVAATLNNIGPGMNLVGPSGNFAHFTPISKIVLTFMMIIGRLEIYPVLILLMPNLWKK